jgi:hypothetical protein
MYFFCNVRILNTCSLLSKNAKRNLTEDILLLCVNIALVGWTLKPNNSCGGRKRVCSVCEKNFRAMANWNPLPLFFEPYLNINRGKWWFFFGYRSGVHKFRTTKFSTVEPSILGPQYGTCFISPYWRPDFLTWLLRSCKICAPLTKACLLPRCISAWKRISLRVKSSR